MDKNNRAFKVKAHKEAVSFITKSYEEMEEGEPPP
jgi:hypothetical protein